MAETVQLPKRPVGRPRRNAPQWQLMELRKEGWSLRKIALATGLGYGTVRRACSAAASTATSSAGSWKNMTSSMGG